MPLIGKHFALDTETTLLRKNEEYITPELVLMQVTDGRTVDLVLWDQADRYLALLDKYNKDYNLYMFNVGFDVSVLQNKLMYDLLEKGRLIDVGIRHMLYGIAEVGYYDEPVSLAGCCKHHLKYEMVKDAAIRTGFTRDSSPTLAQLEYAAIDAAATWMLADIIPAQPTDSYETRGAYALYNIEKNGMLVDINKMRFKRGELQAEMKLQEEELRLHGFEPDSKYMEPLTQFNKILKLLEIPSVDSAVPSAAMSKYLLCYTAGLLAKPTYDEFRADLKSSFLNWLTGQSLPIARQDKKDIDQVLKLQGFDDLLDCQRRWPIFKLIELFIRARAEKQIPEEIMGAVLSEYQANAGWPKDSFVKPTVYLQKHLKQLESVNPELRLSRTKASQDEDDPDKQKISLNKDELWKFVEQGVKDPFLETYMAYKHNEKTVGTYLDEKYVRPDGRTHTRFKYIVRTGRTSSSEPNLQNLPKDDNIREIYIAPPGHALVAIDFSQLELCTLAQHCFKMYGISRMRELINANIDLHKWFACRVANIITDANDYDAKVPFDADRVIDLTNKSISKKDIRRQQSKCANFGFPGGMQPPRFLSHCRTQKVPMDLKTAELLRTSWIKCFPELEHHMRPQMMPKKHPEDETWFQAATIYGMKRVKCSANSAMNLVFQGLASFAMKHVLWRLTRAGFKVVNFVHDEAIIEIPLNLLDEKFREATVLMVKAAEEILPDVRIKVEGAAMLCWDKNAELRTDAKGNVIPYTTSTTETR